MKTRIIILLLCLSGSAFSQHFLNLDFEYANATQKPMKWYAGGPGYSAILDSRVKSHGSVSLRIESNNPSGNQFGVCTGYFPVEIVKGKEIEFTGWIKTSDATGGYAGLWWRVDGKTGTIGFDNMHDRGITGTTDWKKVSIKMKVEEDVTNINFGGLFSGNGTAWFDNFEILIDGKKFTEMMPRTSGPTTTELSWLKKNIYPLKTFEPASSPEDLEILKKLIGNAHLVALGETSHGSSEIFKMKNRIIKYLAGNAGFNIFSIEANMPEAYKLNDYTLRSNGDPASLIKGMYFWTWSTQEMLDMVRWMNQFNKSGGNISFTGFDMQFHQGAIKELKDAFENDKKISAEIESLSTVLDSAAIKRRGSGIRSASPADRQRIMESLKNLQKYVAASKKSAEVKTWLFQNIRVIEQSLDPVNRDRFMADNLMWIRSQNQGSKIVAWAHNGHIQKSPSRMGQFLSDSLKNDYLTIGFTFYKGSYTATGSKGLTAYTAQEAYPGTYEYFFNAIKEPVFILDLRSVKKQNDENSRWLTQNLAFRSVGAVNMENEFNDTDLPSGFDLMIFINESSASTLLK